MEMTRRCAKQARIVCGAEVCFWHKTTFLGSVFVEASARRNGSRTKNKKCAAKRPHTKTTWTDGMKKSVGHVLLQWDARALPQANLGFRF